MAFIGGNRYLSQEEMENNAILIKDYFIGKGWTIQAICGMLGNMQTESTMNPQLWESMDEGNTNGGFGLVQWTPAQKLIDWAGVSFQEGYKQCDRIQYELENNIQWIPTPEYNFSFAEYSISVATPRELAMVFIRNYERPLNPNQPIRGQQAENWFEFFGGIVPPPIRNRKMPFYMYLRRRY